MTMPLSSFANTPVNSGEVNLIERRIHSINQNIRCMVCESQTIDDSNSALAKDLRSIVRKKVLSGESDLEIYTFFSQRYGDYIILKPPFRSSTIILWFTPVIVFFLGLFVIILNQRNKVNKIGYNDEG